MLRNSKKLTCPVPAGPAASVLFGELNLKSHWPLILNNKKSKKPTCQSNTVHLNAPWSAITKIQLLSSYNAHTLIMNCLWPIYTSHSFQMLFYALSINTLDKMSFPQYSQTLEPGRMDNSENYEVKASGSNLSSIMSLPNVHSQAVQRNPKEFIPF